MYISKKSELDQKLLVIGYKQFRFGSDSRISETILDDEESWGMHSE